MHFLDLRAPLTVTLLCMFPSCQCLPTTPSTLRLRDGAAPRLSSDDEEIGELGCWGFDVLILARGIFAPFSGSVVHDTTTHNSTTQSF